MQTILVVDDDVDLREVLCDALESAGYRAIAATDGRDALDRLRLDPAIAVVLLDLMMPVMSGWEFRDAQLADPAIRDVPVIVMTAAADLSKTPIAASKILHKPVSLDLLVAALVAVTTAK